MDFTAEQYVDDVLSGEVVVCRWVRLACERHRRDLETGGERGLFFDERAAKIAIAFFQVLRHWKGEWAGRPVALEPWQQFMIWSLFGWKRENGARRFRQAYVEVPRKNGKTTVAAGIGLLMMLVDNEPGAEIYTAATKRDQARIAHKDAAEMVRQSPELRQMVTRFKDNLHVVESASKFEPLGRDADSTDGLNIHGAICDEVHAWKSRDLWDKIETATGARRQPLVLGITTAGYDRQSLCFNLHDYTEKVVSGVIEDDSFFGLIYTIDEGDDWTDEAVWFKANPNLGVSKKLHDMRTLAARAKEMPTALNAFLRLHLNVWTQASERWIHPDKWRACGREPVPSREALAGRRCFGGLDLSSTLDVTAWVLVFPPVAADEPWWVLPRFWIPEENILDRVRRDRVPYDVWVRDGWMEATPGAVVDYDWIEHAIRADAAAFDLAEAAFDPWNATSVSNHLLDEGVKMVEFRQGYVSMNPAMKAMEVAIAEQRLGHGNHPVLNWMADNLVARMGPAGNVKPDKNESSEKIDGMVALVMGHYRASLQPEKKQSRYASGKGIRTIG